MEPLQLKKEIEELTKLIESSPPDLIERVRGIFNNLTKIEDQEKVVKELEPLMSKMIPLILKHKGLDKLFPKNAISTL